MTPRAALRLAWILALAPAAAASGIRIADRPDLGPFTSLQTAVNAALDGELLVVEEGSYSGLAVIDGKSLTILGMPGGGTEYMGGLVVRNLTVGQQVFVAGLDLYNPSGIGLSLSNNQGHVRIQDCSIWGGKSSSSGNPIAHAGVSVVGCPNVVLASCETTGGYLTFLSGLPPVQGGAGVESTNSAIALFDCIAKGGTGSHETFTGGKGGSGLKINGWGAFLSGTTLRGGAGGEPDYIGCESGGPGGDALTVINAQVQMLDSPLIPGPGGHGLCGPNGPPGSAFTNSGGVLVTLPGEARVLRSPYFASDASPLTLTLSGMPGDKVWLFRTYEAAFSFLPGLGTWTVHRPAFVPMVPLGIVPASGTLTANVSAPSMAAGLTHDLMFAQALVVDTTGKGYVSSALHAAVFDASGFPDCDNSQVNDFLELLQHTVGDCDKNLAVDTCEIASGSKPDCNLNDVPDGCDLAAGVEQDCNANGKPDSCDIASGFAQDCNANGKPDSCDIASKSSPDANQNGIPDECEPIQALTWWVDDDALPGGNGSQAQPFQTIGQGLNASFHGDTVIVRDGVYKGAGNKNLDPLGRAVVIRSENGPASCVIDLELQGRAFYVHNNEGSGLIFRGLTIRNGNAQNAPVSTAGGAFYLLDGASPRIEFCVIEDCTAVAGGAIHAFKAPLHVRDTLFRNCHATGTSIGSAGGGAVRTNLPGDGLSLASSFVNCVFEGCTSAARGGAIWSAGNSELVLSHSKFFGNTANEGGALASVFSGFSSPGRALSMNACLLAGNSAAEGGAILFSYSASGMIGIPGWTLSGCTFVQNSASSLGGTFELSSSPTQAPPLEIFDTVIWSSAAPTGSVLKNTAGLADVLIDWCDVQGGSAAFALNPGSSLAWGGGNIDLDPLFVDLDGPDNNPLTFADNDYRLAAASPCSDAGGNGVVALDRIDIDGDGDVSELTPLDLLLQPRFVENPVAPNTGQGTPPLVDMGAFERQP